MIERFLIPQLEERLDEFPAVALIGPRQVGKTTLALEIGKKRRALYLDLESEQDRAKLLEPELYLSDHLDRLVILDEIHRAPGLFPVLRGLIDRSRRIGRRTGLYLFLGSASFDLLKQSGESLAGRISFLELPPLTVLEAVSRDAPKIQDRLWVRGGFPESFLALNDGQSFRWRQDFIRTYLERDIPQFGPRISAETLRRFWTMLAHHQGGLLNVSQLARNLGVDTKTAASYIGLLSDLLLVRRLPSWHDNLGKRLVKSPKIYIRDSGILHALLSLPDQDALLGHPVVGASWEGFVIENLLALAPAGTERYFYRTGGGAEIDLFLVFPGGRTWAVEIKRSLTPKPERGFHAACTDLSPSERFVIYPGTERFRLADNLIALSLPDLARRLSGSE